MASRRKETIEDANFQIMQIVSENPNITTRELAEKVGVSNGSAFYLLNSLIEKGFVKFENFVTNKNKKKYTYLLTPIGIREKYKLTIKFLERKKKLYNELRVEIKKLQKENLKKNKLEIKL